MFWFVYVYIKKRDEVEIKHVRFFCLDNVFIKFIKFGAWFANKQTCESDLFYLFVFVVEIRENEH